MATVNNTRPITKTVFIGRAWLNEAKNGEHKGVKFLSLRLDRGMDISLSDKDSILLWPNTKREGKIDADFRASIEVPV